MGQRPRWTSLGRGRSTITSSTTTAEHQTVLDQVGPILVKRPAGGGARSSMETIRQPRAKLSRRDVSTLRPVPPSLSSRQLQRERRGWIPRPRSSGVSSGFRSGEAIRGRAFHGWTDFAFSPNPNSAVSWGHRPLTADVRSKQSGERTAPPWRHHHSLSASLPKPGEGLPLWECPCWQGWRSPFEPGDIGPELGRISAARGNSSIPSRASRPNVMGGV